MKNIKIVVTMLKKLLYILNKRQQKACIGAFLMMLISAIFETLGVSVIIPFILAMMNPDKLLENKYVAVLAGMLNIDNSRKLVIYMSVGVILIYVVKNAVLIFSDHIQIHFRNSLEKDLSVLMLSSYMKRPYPYYIETNSSIILRGIGSDISGVAQIVDGFFSIITELLTFILLGLFLLAINPAMALGIVIIIIVCAGGIIFGFKGIINASGKMARSAFAEQSKCAYQAVNGIKEIIVMQRRESFIDEYKNAAATSCKCNTKYQFSNRIPNHIIEVVFIGSLVMLMGIISQNGNIGLLIPQMGALAVACVRILPSISTITGSVNTLVYYHSALDAAVENIKDAKAYEDELRQYKLHSNADCEMGSREFKHEVEISKIVWKYNNSDKKVLNELSMTICKGDAIGLIGESGAGKTTLADCILGLLKPSAGNILVDGTDIFAIPREWAKMIGYVPQTVFLTDDTIRRNVAFGIPKSEIEDDMIWHALREAQMENFVKELPQKLDTVVGERGIKFSGGQRQRIAIARALYYDPEIMVLDEATSALDNETESAVMSAIDSLQKNKTLIIVAHRLTTIQNCNKIYEIKNGQAYLRNKGEVIDSANE